jgi:hypothetical protein
MFRSGHACVLSELDAPPLSRKQVLMNASEIETKVQDATGNEAWGASGTTLLEIATSTQNDEERALIQGVLLQRLRETGSNWRQCYKALNIIEYCIKNGSERYGNNLIKVRYKRCSLSIAASSRSGKATSAVWKLANPSNTASPTLARIRHVFSTELFFPERRLTHVGLALRESTCARRPSPSSS